MIPTESFVKNQRFYNMNIKEYTSEIKGLSFMNVDDGEVKIFTTCKMAYSTEHKKMRLFASWDNHRFQGKEYWGIVQKKFDLGIYEFVLGHEQLRYLEYLVKWYDTKFLGNTSESIKMIAHCIKKGTYSWEERKLIHTAITVKDNWG